MVIDPDLRVEAFPEKDAAAENGGVDFEIGDIGTSAHLYWRLKKFLANAGGRIFLFSWDRLGGG